MKRLAILFNAVRDADIELDIAFTFFVVACIGWSIGSTPLALVGMLGCTTTGALYLWQRNCLVGVSYSRSFSATKANFGDEIDLDLRIVNDKLLPLSFLQSEDEVPATLEIVGGSISPSTTSPFSRTLVTLSPMLPYQALTVHLKVRATQRGLHSFGPVVLTSGDPIPLRTRNVVQRTRQHLLVYPKIVPIAPTSIASRVLTGDVRSRFELIEDPSRVAGVRDYRKGDSTRRINWRATARKGTLLVREFESTVTKRVAVFVDFQVPQLDPWTMDPPELEFVICVAASLITDLATHKIPTGLYSSGAIGRQSLAYPISSAPGALPQMLEGLAQASPLGPTRFANVLASEALRLQRGTSVAVIAANYSPDLTCGINELRRRCTVTTVWVKTDRGSPPSPGISDASMIAEYTDDWQNSSVLELAS